jgi:uroporphyrinogen-III synthase
MSEAVANYLQTYIVYRKRKIYIGERTIQDLVDVLKKYKDETFLFPTSNSLKPIIPKTLKAAKIKYDRAELFRTVVSDLSDLENVFYDILVFFSPTGIDSLLKNFPDFKQNDTRIAVYGKVTQKAVEKAGFRCDIIVPNTKTKSMTTALENYIVEANKRKR